MTKEKVMFLCTALRTLYQIEPKLANSCVVPRCRSMPNFIEIGSLIQKLRRVQDVYGTPCRYRQELIQNLKFYYFSDV